MTKSELEVLLIELVCMLQEMSGRGRFSVDANTKPVLDVPGFDSLNGVEVTVEVMDRLKIELDFNNVLVEDERALTIAQAAERLAMSLPASVHG
jgi:acyl carrier protein